MSLSTDYDELVVHLAPDPVPSVSTIVRRARRLQELAWHEFADGPPERTPRRRSLVPCGTTCPSSAAG